MGRIGLPLPGTDARIVDLETGKRDLAPGEVGEIIVKVPQVMQGYWMRPEETAAALRTSQLVESLATPIETPRIVASTIPSNATLIVF
jgi:acyl-CoA synthetase (AMP-forming)/AMP-acid ligase II